MEFPIREDQYHSLFVCGLSETVVDSVEEFNASFLPASRNRSVVNCVTVYTCVCVAT